MDNFMDKIAQKFSAQDIMKANASAEATELKKMQMQISEYETLLGNMRQVNLKNITMTESMGIMIKQLQSMISTVDGKQRGEFEEFVKQREQLEEINKSIQNLVVKLEKKSDEIIEGEHELEKIRDAELKEEELKEYIHTESVKVYRNVQAVLAQGFKDLEEANQARENKVTTKLRVIKGCGIACVVLMSVNFLVTCAHFIVDLLIQVFGFTFF